MPTAEKAQVIEATRERYQRATGVYFTEYRGLKVKEIQQLRHDLSSAGAEIQVVKNTLFRLAAGDDASNFLPDFSGGPTAVTFVYKDEAEVAKALVDFGKKNKKFVIKGGFLGGKAYTGPQVEALSKLPPRDVLIAQVIGAIAAPLTSLIGVVEALYADPIRTIGAVADKVAEGSPLPEVTTTEDSSATAEADSTATVEETAAPSENPTEPSQE